MADHHLTTTVQWCCKISEKPIVTTNNGLFLVLETTVQNQHNLRSNANPYRPVVVLRPGRPEVRILPVAPRAAPYGVLLFLFFADFIGAAKEGIRTAHAPRLGETLRRVKKRIAMYFCNALFVFVLCQNSFSNISSAASVYRNAPQISA